MRLSAAMLLASTLGESPNNKGWDCCLLGISCHALGKSNVGNDEALARWPWLNQPATKSYGGHDAGMLAWAGWNWNTAITDLCFRVEEKEITVEQAAEWVANIEPKEEEVNEINVNCVDIYGDCVRTGASTCECGFG